MEYYDAFDLSFVVSLSLSFHNLFLFCTVMLYIEINSLSRKLHVVSFLLALSTFLNQSYIALSLLAFALMFFSNSIDTLKTYGVVVIAISLVIHLSALIWLAFEFINMLKMHHGDHSKKEK